MRVLVVGDKKHERESVVELVESLDHQVEQAEDGLSAWKRYTRHHYDVIISDYLMPEMNGLELCRRVREDCPYGRYTYVIICSARAEQHHVLAGFESGVDDYLRKPARPVEVRARLISARRVTTVHNELARKNRELRDLSQELRAHSRTDPLTGVGNRLRFTEDVVELLNSPGPFYFALSDIDNFKRYNDTYGHFEGDKVLKSVAQCLVPDSHAVYRFGGEEFLAVLRANDSESAFARADRLRARVETLSVEHSQNQPYGKVTLSLGVAPLTAMVPEQVELDLRLADELLYEAKEGGRNRVVKAKL